MDFSAWYAEAGAVVDRLPAVPIVYLQGMNQIKKTLAQIEDGTP
jgi:hypothetical protein